MNTEAALNEALRSDKAKKIYKPSAISNYKKRLSQGKLPLDKQIEILQKLGYSIRAHINWARPGKGKRPIIPDPKTGLPAVSVGCQACDGMGSRKDNSGMDVMCPQCNGTGEIYINL